MATCAMSPTCCACPCCAASHCAIECDEHPEPFLRAGLPDRLVASLLPWIRPSSLSSFTACPTRLARPAGMAIVLHWRTAVKDLLWRFQRHPDQLWFPHDLGCPQGWRGERDRKQQQSHIIAGERGYRRAWAQPSLVSTSWAKPWLLTQASLPELIVRVVSHSLFVPGARFLRLS